MSDYFRHARIVGRSLEMGAPDRAACRSARTSGCRATASGSSIRCQAARNPASWMARVPGGGRRTTRSVSRGSAVVHPAARRSLPRRTISSRGRATGPRCCGSSSRAPGSTPGCRRCTTAACSGRVFPEFQAISWRVVRDFYHKYTVDEHTLLTIRNLERLADDASTGRGSASRIVLAGPAAAGAARAGAAAARRRQVARRRPRGRERAHGRATCSTGCRLPARRARHGRCSSSAITCACRWSAFRRDTEDPDIVKRVRRARRHRGPAEDAVPA